MCHCSNGWHWLWGGQNIIIHYEKKRCFATIRHLQLIVFTRYECHQTSCKSCKNCNSSYYGATHYNSIITLLQQLLFNYYATPHDYNHNVMLTSFSSIHPNLTHGIMRIFCDFFEISISIVHYEYLF